MEDQTSSRKSSNASTFDDYHKLTWPQRFKRRVGIIWRNITVEPVIFFIMFSSGVDNVSLSQLKIQKACKIDFEFNDTVCDNLLEENYSDENTLVQDEVRSSQE